MQLTVNNANIERVEQVRLLGVEVDSQLKFDKNVDKVCAKVNQKAFLISRKFFLFDSNFKTILFKLFLLPHFDYCSTLFTFTSASNLNKLNRCYYKNLKLFLNINISKHNLESQTSALNPTNLLPLDLRLFFHYCCFIHSIFYNSVCTPLLSLFKSQTSEYDLRSKFLLSNVTTSYGIMSLSFVGTKLLNIFLFPHRNHSCSIFREYLKSNCLYYYRKISPQLHQ